jgi:methylated-DNA-[protein]-cysteine S-methyltransferase
MQLLVDRIESPIGTIVLITNGDRLCALDFADYEQRMLGLLSKRYQSFELIERINPHRFSSKIRAYLAGDYASVRDIEIDLDGTDFQQLVWQELRQIPIGKTITYGELATRVGKPTAARAVGMANSLNPIAIVVPCHRVIGAKSKLTGYAGGLARKQWLLAHEGVSFRSESQEILIFDRHPLTSGNAIE